jgi:hypothetical protein
MAVSKGFKETKKKLNKISKEYENLLRLAINENSVLLATYTKVNKLTGGTSPTRLRARTGRLKSSTRAKKARIMANKIVGGIQFGTAYASLHIGKKGQKTVIRPKTGKFLAIPLTAAKTAAGAASGKPLDKSVFGETFIKRSKKGNLIIFGKRVAQKGKSIGQTKGKIVPLFVLKTQVTIPVRIDAKALVKWIKPKLIKDVKKIKDKI